MHRVYYILILSILILGDTFNSFSQDIYFNKRASFISYQQENHANSLLATDSGYIVAGISTGSNSGYDIVNLGYFDLSGEKGEIKSYFGNNGLNYYLGYSGCLINNSNNNLLLCGYFQDDTPQSHGLLMMFDNKMDTIWTQSYSDTSSGSITHYYLYQLKETNDNNLIITGIQNVDGGNTDILLMKTDAQGNKIWERTYGEGGSIYEWGYSVCETFDYGYVIGGWKLDNYNNESADPIVLKVDSAGNFQWQKNLGGPFKDGKAMITKSPDMHYIIGTNIADSMATPSLSFKKANILKMDTSGEIIWSKKYGPSAVYNQITNIHCEDDGTIVSCGYFLGYGTHYFGWLLKMNSDGDSIWMRYYDHLKEHNSENLINDCKPDFYNGYIMYGDLLPWPPDTGNRDIWLLKVDSLGCDTPGCQPGVWIPQEMITHEELKVYPNPANNRINCQCSMFNVQCEIWIYDVFGRLQKKVIVPKSAKEVSINVTGFTTGLYMAVLLNEKEIIASRKFIVKH